MAEALVVSANAIKDLNGMSNTQISKPAGETGYFIPSLPEDPFFSLFFFLFTEELVPFFLPDVSVL